jgi:hypothetical protein
MPSRTADATSGAPSTTPGRIADGDGDHAAGRHFFVGEDELDGAPPDN